MTSNSLLILTAMAIVQLEGCTPAASTPTPPSAATAGDRPPARRAAFTVTTLELSPSEDKEIGPGSLDVTARSGRFYDPKMQSCTARVEALGRTWAAEQKLGVTVVDVGDTHLQMLLRGSSGQTPGYYELVYRYHGAGDDRSAAAHLLFYTLAGEPREPVLSNEEMNDISRRLLEAIACRP